MGMEHKAFVFRYDEFERELRPLLEDALARDSVEGLVAFIKADPASFRDPYEGDPLTDNWEDLLETKDVHQYGDFALTKYYNPSADIGLGQSWVTTQELLERNLGTSAPVLGRAIEFRDRVFDPGKMGSYFQSEQDVRHNLAAVEGMAGRDLESLAALLRKAADDGAGLYVTF